MDLAGTPFFSMLKDVRELEQQFLEKVNVHFVWLAELREEIRREFPKPGIDLLPKTPSVKRNRQTKRKVDWASPKAPATTRVTRSHVAACVVDDSDAKHTAVVRSSKATDRIGTSKGGTDCAVDDSKTIVPRTKETSRGRTSKRVTNCSLDLESQSSPKKKLKATENEGLDVESDAGNKKTLAKKDRAKTPVVIDLDTTIDSSAGEFNNDNTSTAVVKVSPEAVSTSNGNVKFSKPAKNTDNYQQTKEPEAALNESHVELSPQSPSTSSFFGGAVRCSTTVSKPRLHSNKHETAMHRLSNASRASMSKSRRSSIKQQPVGKHKLSVSVLNHLQLEAELFKEQQHIEAVVHAAAIKIPEIALGSAETGSYSDCQTPLAAEIKQIEPTQKSSNKKGDDINTKKENVPVRISRTKQRLLDDTVTASPKSADTKVIEKVQSGFAKTSNAFVERNDNVGKTEICRATRSKMRLKVDDKANTTASFARTPSPHRANISRLMPSDTKKYSTAKFKPGNVSLLGSQLKQRPPPSNLVTFLNSTGKASFIRSPAKTLQVQQEMEQQKKAETQRVRDLRQQEALLKKEGLLKAKLEEQKRKREERQHQAALTREQKQREHEEQLKKKLEAKETNSALKDTEVQKLKQRGWREAEDRRRQDEERERLKLQEERRRQQEGFAKQRKQKEQEELEKRSEAKRKEQERIQREQQELKLLRVKEAHRARMLAEPNKAPLESSAATLHNSTLNTSESYNMTLPHANTKPATDSNYDITDLQSGDETDDDEKPRKKIPFWAQGAHLKAAVIQQYHVPPCVEELFGFIETPDLSKVFPIQRKRFKARTSSAIWNSPLLGSIAEHKVSERRRPHSISSP